MTTPQDNWCSQTSPGLSPQAQAVRPPQDRNLTVSSLCAMGWRPIMITGLIRDLLIRHFSAPSQINEADLRHLVWREDERTGILIESIHRWRGDLVEKRPAVIIKRNAYQNLRLLIGERSGITEQGMYEYSTFWVGSHTLFCIHGSGASVEILATEVQRNLTEFAPVVIDYLGLFKWTVTEVGGISELEEARETFVVPITVGWAYEEHWRLDLESLKLRKVPLSVLLDGALVQGTR